MFDHKDMFNEVGVDSTTLRNVGGYQVAFQKIPMSTSPNLKVLSFSKHQF